MNTTISSRNRFYLLFVLTQLLSALLGSYEIWSSPGWPVNHENSAFALRAVYTAEEFRAGNFFSIWSVHENHGLGSPQALYYPRLFFIVAALGICVGLQVKTALVGTILFFAVLGGTGLYGALRELRLPRNLCWILSCCLIHLNYTQSDLISRGAMAEFCLIALLPFLGWWSLRLLRRGEFSWWIIPLWTALFFAHTTLMAYAVPIPLAAAVAALIVHRCRRRQIVTRALISGAALAALLLPYFLLTYAQRKFFLFEIGYMRFLNPRYFFHSPLEHLPRSLLLHPRYPVNPWYDPGLLIALTTAAAILGSLVIRRPELRQELRKRWYLPAGLLLPLAWYLFLQNRISWPLYLTSDFFIVLQFPWRLLSFTGLLAILLLGLLLKFLHGKIPPRLLLALAVIPALLAAVGSLGTQLKFPHDRIEPATIENPPPFNWLEYIPILPQFRDKVDSDEFRRRTTSWIKDYAGRPPMVEGPMPQSLRLRELSLGVQELTSLAAKPYVLTVRANWSNLALVTVKTPDGTFRLATWRTREDPRLRFAVPAGECTITIRTPSLGNSFRRLGLPDFQMQTAE